MGPSGGSDHERVVRRLTSRKRMWLAGGLASLCLAAVSLFALIFLVGTAAGPDVKLLALFSAAALAGMTVGLVAAKECLERALVKTGFPTPEDLVKYYYEAALEPDVNGDRLVHLLHPQGLALLGDDPVDALEDRWGELRGRCACLVPSGTGHMVAEVSSVGVTPTDEGDCQKVEAIVELSKWSLNRKYSPSRLLGKVLVRIPNEAVKTSQSWRLMSPFPEDLQVVERPEISAGDEEEPFDGSPGIPG